MIEVRDELVYRFVPSADRLTAEAVELVWRIVSVGGVEVRRTLADALSGELFDDVWLDENGRVRSQP